MTETHNEGLSSPVEHIGPAGEGLYCYREPPSSASMATVKVCTEHRHTMSQNCQGHATAAASSKVLACIAWYIAMQTIYHCH